MMNTKRPNAILLLGPTGSGKTPLGTVAEKIGLPDEICRHFDFGAQLRKINAAPVDSISTGSLDIIREVLEQGRLLEPHESFVAAQIFQAWHQQQPLECVIILNGLPRTIEQAITLEDLLHVCLVVELEADDTTIHERIAENSGGDRTERMDDQPTAVQRRLDIYRARTMPLIEHYRQKKTDIIKEIVTPESIPNEIWSHIQETWTQRESEMA